MTGSVNTFTVHNVYTHDAFSLLLSLTYFSILSSLAIHSALALSSAGYELLFQPEVVRIYMSLLKESKNPTVLEASAGAIQNLCAGRWTVRAPVCFPIQFHSS